MNSPTISVVIPAYNEAKNIYQTVMAAGRISGVTEILVVDDASSDQTNQLAADAGAKVITLAQNSGKGAALTEGVQRAQGQILLLLDGDLGDTAVEGGELLQPLLDNTADMTIAKFPKARKKGGFGLVKGLAQKGIKFYTGLEMQAPLSGQRALTRAVANDILPFASGYGVEVTLTIKVFKMGYRIKEVPVKMTHAETGRDIAGFKHRGKQFAHVAKELLACFFHYRTIK